MKKLTLFLLFSFLAYAQIEIAAPKSIKNTKYEQKLLGTHKLSLQWISWDRFGKAKVIKQNDIITITGEQRIKDEYLQINGTISNIKAKSFVFDGVIITKINFIAKGKECRREGKMEFKITKKRRYWRLQDMQNPCANVVDYVDIFFK
ncbi:MAG: hypothetical protein U9N49_03955 [Campylobacterota bacterium]|nr:hypothetical protein [Campylobacterota bacterium]